MGKALNIGKFRFGVTKSPRVLGHPGYPPENHYPTMKSQLRPFFSFRFDYMPRINRRWQWKYLGTIGFIRLGWNSLFDLYIGDYHFYGELIG